MSGYLPPDHKERAAAIDPGNSFIVQAPAGSGKTELLTRRFLSLLAVVDTPEEILAITFTRKAASEMRRRVLEALLMAQNPTSGDSDPERLRLAQGALARSRVKGWMLTENPARLRVSTIDGFNSYLVGRMPWLTRLGGQPAVMENPRELYGRAALTALSWTGEEGGHAEALKEVLAHLDNRADRLADHLARFLSRRDQWLKVRQYDLGDPGSLRPLLEENLAEMVSARLVAACEVLSPHLGELAFLAAYASGNLGESAKISPYSASGPPGVLPEEVARWRELVPFFLTQKGEVRKRPDASSGWPKGCDPALLSRCKEALERLREDPPAAETLHSLRELPDPCYSDEEWAMVLPVIRVGDLGLACLRVAFREMGAVDFTEMALSAQKALGETGNPSELLLSLDRRLAHILVDEFQDTSVTQFHLLNKLTEGWTRGDGRTLFLVGDPMQSIYRFREAQVGLFGRARTSGVGEVNLTPLNLTVNFRTNAPLVARFNEIFSRVFPEREDPGTGGVAYAPSVAKDGEGVGEVIFHPFAGTSGGEEAVCVVDEAVRFMEEDRTGSVAILVRARTHLPEIISELQARSIPFGGEELDPLADRPAVRDLVSLAKALGDPTDRLAWLSVLRAPWCGLTLSELRALTQGGGFTVAEMIPQAIGAATLSEEGRQNLIRVWEVLRPAMEKVGRVDFRPLLESVWAVLGGAAYATPQEFSDVKAALDLVEKVAPGGLPAIATLDRAMEGLYSKPGPELCRVHVMTLHKAKGLEFDCVLMPGLGRRPRSPEKALISWDETPSGGLLLGVTPPTRVGAKSMIMNFLAELDSLKESNERLRLLYVGMTRAKARVVLFGGAKYSEKSGGFSPEKGSLLYSLWPVVKERFDLLDPPPVQEEPTGQTPGVLSVQRISGWVTPKFLMPSIAPERDTGGVDEGEVEEEQQFDWALEERKFIGIMAHEYFERIGRDGLAAWSAERLNGEGEFLRKRLKALGVLTERLSSAAGEVRKAVEAVLTDPVAREFFQAGEGALSEFGITVPEGVSFVRKRIDRTYLDRDGVRWIIDFKLTSHEGGDMEGFLAAQKERHRKQLSEYAGLMRALEPDREVRAALYYPLMRRKVEVEV